MSALVIAIIVAVVLISARRSGGKNKWSAPKDLYEPLNYKEAIIGGAIFFSIIIVGVLFGVYVMPSIRELLLIR